jgi:hypothetical protein
MSVRQVASFDRNYWEFNRGERNCAAILCTELCRLEDAVRFLIYIGLKGEIGPDLGIYFKYAFCRDFRNKIEDNGMKKGLIRNPLKLPRIDDILDMPIIDINQIFGAGDEPSQEYAHYPGK